MEGDWLWFFSTVAWPSEAVRVREESITSIDKRVAASFYGPRGVACPIKAQTQHPGGLIQIRPTAGAGWLTDKRGIVLPIPYAIIGPVPTCIFPAIQLHRPKIMIGIMVRDFVPTGELRVKETLRNLDGDVRIESIEQLGSEERVYNLEFQITI